MPTPAPPIAPAGAQMPPLAPAYSTQQRNAAPSVVMTADGRAKRTIINEDAGRNYSSISDPSLNPGLGKRFRQPGGSSPSSSGAPGTGF